MKGSSSMLPEMHKDAAPTARRTGQMRHLIPHLCALTMVASLATACHKADEVPSTVVSVEIATAKREPILERVVADAVLAPLVQAAIVPKISAPIRKLYVVRGAQVKVGQLLASLESSDLDAAMRENKGGYTQAKAQYATTTEASVPEDYQKAELDLKQAKANLDLQQTIVDARKDLFAQGAIPGRDLETAKAALVQSNVTYDMAQKHFASQASVSREAALQNAQGQLDAAQGKYEGSQASFSYSQIRSPINGVVTDRPLFAGEMASSGQPIITVMDTTFLLAKTHVSQAQAQRLRVGTDAEVTIPEVDIPVSGKVSFISPALDPGSSTVEVWVKVPNKDRTLKVGATVRVAIIAHEIKDGIVIPTIAVVTSPDGKKMIMLIGSDSVAHQRPVEIGVAEGEKTQIVGGLKAGDRLVASGAYAMEDGTKVKAAAADEKDDTKPDAGNPDSNAKPEGKQ
jgi:HlyD family secretion protein